MEEYEKLTPEEKIRWHLENDCICTGWLDDWESPFEHYENCPLHNPNAVGWNYFDHYGIIPHK